MLSLYEQCTIDREIVERGLRSVGAEVHFDSQKLASSNVLNLIQIVAVHLE